MPKQLLAIASAGGHWIQLLRLRPAFEGFTVTYATTLSGLAEQSDELRFVVIPDCNRDEPLRVLRSAWAIFRVIRWLKPRAIVTTGAMPGLLAIMLGYILGIRTIWIDSVANSEELSASGKLASRFSSLFLTQWEHLEGEKGAIYSGSVL